MIGIFLCVEDGVEVYPRQGKSIFPHQKYRLPFLGDWYFSLRGRWSRSLSPSGEIHLPHQKYRLSFWTVGIFLSGRCTNARQMHGAEKIWIASVNTAKKKPHMIRPPTPWAGFAAPPPSRSRCAQARGQLPPRQAAHERVKAIGAHRQPAVRARPQVRIFPRRQRRKTPSHRRIRIPPFRLQNYYAFG